MLKDIRIFAVFILLFLFSCSSPQKNLSEKNQIEILIKKYTQAFDAKDFRLFASYCHKDFRFFTLDGQIQTKVTVAPFLTRILQGWKQITSEIEDLDIIYEGKLAVARYTNIYHFTLEGRSDSMTARITVVFKKDGDNWQIYQFHMSRRYS